MRHQKKKYTLDRKTSAREALMRTLSISLIKSGKIKTTTAKAKALKSYFEKIISIASHNTLFYHRQINKILHNESVAQIVIKKYLPQFTAKKSGHLRLSKIGYRKGDGAEITQIEIL
jgi:large subunit ribosomal protein L17